MKIAVSGKGGVGKTTVAATLAKLFADSHKKVYAVDADPDACLAAAVGIPEEQIGELRPLVEMKELIDEKSSGGGAFFSLNPNVDDVLEQYSISLGNIKFLRMGGIKQGGSACYCRENSFLHALMNGLLFDRDSAVILDMGAGIEHLTRGTARSVDVMLVVAEPSRNSVNTANLVKKLAMDLGIKNIRFIGNKIRNEKERDFILKYLGEDEVLGFIPFDDEIWESSMESGPAAELGGELLRSMKEIHEKLLREVDK
ncbi:MAG: carbon monoxide dehydrogenase [Firmicutes bacterium HGW-Firmicutes-14]|jgi:CO dehydrogenase maturation factor|nr:MAG: carbon monoxide dehydrogenase [Firmicutes bacterium HGW-Firmicutes-14]